MRPLLEHVVAFCGFSDAGDKAMLRFLMVPGQEKREQIEGFDVVSEDLLEVSSRRVCSSAHHLFVISLCLTHTVPA
jgi:hypothetical protein